MRGWSIFVAMFAGALFAGALFVGAAVFGWRDNRMFQEPPPAAAAPSYVDRRIWLRISDLDAGNHDRYKVFECREVSRKENKP